ncbi:MAG: response regulator [Bacteroidetes bacterium]|nr:response regulator [Bacteroidota bacterium]
MHKLISVFPLVKGYPHIRFYTGMSLINSEGQTLGSLCIVDTVPRKLTLSQKRGLETLAGQVVLHFELRQQRMQMEVSERYYREIFNHTEGLFCTHDMEGNILSLNPASARSMERTEDSLIGVNLSELLAPYLKTMFGDYLKQIATQKVTEGVMHVISATGKDRYWAYRNVRIDNPGKPSYVVGLSQDITERIRLEKELKKAKKDEVELRKSKEVFFASMSHELRTPLNAITGFTKLLFKKDLPRTEMKYINAIHSAGQNLLAVVNDILDIGRLEADKMVFEEIPFDPRAVISSVIDLLKFQAKEKGIRIIKRIDANVPALVSGDPVRLNQILINLVGNAVKFTEKGRITIQLISRENEAGKTFFIFSVKDTGIGIAKDKIPMLFNIYSQGGTDINRKYGGSGLGLAIVKQLAEKQGGTIAVKSQLEKGSTFIVAIPYRAEVKIDKPVKQGNVSGQVKALTDLNILLADDNILNQQLGIDVLQAAGHVVETVSNGREAIEKISRGKFDVILMDINMPEMNGVEATTYIRSRLEYPLSDIPVIALTAGVTDQEIKKLMGAGMNGYIAKPFDPGLLIEKINSLLNSASRDENSMRIKKDTQPGNEIKSAIDLGYLSRVLNGKKEFITEVIGLFINSVPLTVLDIETSYKSKNWEELRRAAHKIRSSLTTMGMEKTAALAEAIETDAGREGNKVMMAPTIMALSIQCSNAIRDLRKKMIKLS